MSEPNKFGDVVFMFQVDIGYSPTKGYGAVLKDITLKRAKGLKGNSIRQLMRRVSEIISEEEQKKRRFPVEQERRIISTEGY